MTSLLHVDVALTRILAQMPVLGSEIVPLDDSLGRVLAQDIVSDLNLPPLDNAAMDGFALRAQDSTGAQAQMPRTLSVTMDIPAGVMPSGMLNAGEAARIMTGAILPQGADAVIRVEDTDADFSQLERSSLPDTVTLYQAVDAGNAVRRAGENVQVGQHIFRQGRVVSPADIGMLASLGQSSIPVARRARVAIIGSGNELVEVGQPLDRGQIYDANRHALAAWVRQDGGVVLSLPPARDNADSVRQQFEAALQWQPDLILSSAGVSMGAADFVRQILDEMGTIDFWKINLRPGKPLAFGHLAGVPFFGLPGNPVSVMVTYKVLVQAALRQLNALPPQVDTIVAQTAHPMRSDGRRTYARVRLVRDGARWLAHETGTQSSGAHLSMVLADGLLVIPENVGEIATGTALSVLLLRDLPS